MMACNNNVTKGVMPMGKSRREIVGLINQATTKRSGTRPDPTVSTMRFLEGEVRALAPGLKMGAA